MRNRIRKLLTRCTIVLLVGLLYYLFVVITDIKIPCLFYVVTGLHCPGCGVTRMSVALLQFNFKKAFYYHPVLLCSIPLLGVCFGYQALRYVKTGETKLLWWQNTIIWLVVVALVLYCIYRDVA